MARFLIPLGVFAVLAIVLGVAIKHSPDKENIASPLIGKPTPQFALPDLSEPSKTISTNDLKGHWYVLNVWGTWCATCRDEHPMLLEAAKQGVVPIIGLNWRDDDDEARAWLNKLGNPYALVIVDREGRTAIDLGIYKAPESFLVNPQGVIVYKQIGEITPEIWQKQFVARIKGTTAGKT
jgi:cytochrome c biogenesis protein CcmG, thiol:disulfide interchange protein DsbE